MIALLVVVVAIVAVVAVVDPSRTATGTSPETWGGVFCGSLGRWSATITDGATAIQSSSETAEATPTARTALIVGFLDRFADTTQGFARRVARAGAPDTGDGDRIQQAVLQGIAGIEARVGALRAAATALPIDDGAAFEAAVTALVAQFDAMTVPFDRTMRRVGRLDRDDDLSDTLRRLAVCRKYLG